MSFTFYNLLTNDDLQNIILNRIPYNVNKIFEPFEVLYKLINKDNLLGYQGDRIWTKLLKDNQQAIDCVDISTSPKTLIQIKHTKHVNKTQIIGYMKEYVLQHPEQFKEEYHYKLITYTDELYDTLLLKFKQQYLSSKISVQLKPYQQTFINEHIAGILSHNISVINCFCRFGKSYLMKYLQEILHWDILVITTKPTETGDQFKQLGLAYKSIQYLKLNPDYKIQQQYIFIDEAQEQFMTELTETLIDLSRFKKVLFFTGTSETLLEYIYSYEPYYCHFNFGDLLQKLSAKDTIQEDGIQNEIRFPQITFKYVPSDTDIQYDTSDDYIHLIFNRNLNIRSATKLAKEKNYILQTSQTQSNIQDENAHGVYLCIEQYTTGITLLKCVSVEIQHSSFTETDIQSIFRCWNSTLLDIERVVYFRDIQLMQKCVEYIYRQTGQQYITNDIIKKVFSNLVSEEDLNHMTFKQLEINISSHILKQLKNKILHLDTQTKHTLDDAIKDLDQKIQKEFQKENQCPENQQLENQHLTENQQLVKDSIQQIVDKGTINDSFLVLLQRIICQLTFDTINYDVQDNEVNRDYLTLPLFQKLIETESQKVYSLKTLLDQFNSQNELSNFNTAVGQLKLIFYTYDRAVNSRIVKYIRQLVSQSNPIQRYTLLKEYFKTTKTEQKRNAEILTPDNIVDGMIQKLISLYGLEQIKQWQIIEPCCGKGAFLIGLYKVGVPIENLHWNDFNQANVSFCNLLFNQDKGTCQDALEIDYSKYDLVITNPPYNKDKVGQSNTQPQIYQQFGLQFLKANVNCILTKAHFMTFQGKRNDIKEYRQNVINKLVYINTLPKTIFQTEAAKVNIQSGVCYYITDNSKNETCYELVEFQEPQKVYNISKSDPLIMKPLSEYYTTEQTLPQQTHTQNNPSQQKLLQQFEYMNLNYYGIQTNDPLLKISGNVTCYVSKQKGDKLKIDYPLSKLSLKDTTHYKLIFPCAFGNEQRVFSRFEILKPNEICNSSFIGFMVKDEKQANQLKAHLKKYEPLIKRYKTTQHINKQCFIDVPALRLDEDVNMNTDEVVEQQEPLQQTPAQNNLTQNNSSQQKLLQQFEYISLNYYELQTNDPLLKTSGNITCYVSKQKGDKLKIDYPLTKLASKDTTHHKLIFPCASFSGDDQRVFSRFEILKPNEICSASFIGFIVKDEHQAKQLQEHLKKYEPLIKRYKTTQHINRQCFVDVPALRLDVDADEVDVDNVVEQQEPLQQQTTKDNLTQQTLPQQTPTQQTLPQQTLLQQFEYITQNYYELQTNDPLLKTSGNTTCYVSKQKGHKLNIDYPLTKLQLKDTVHYKLIFPRASFSGDDQRVFSRFEILKPNEICNSSFVGFMVKDKEQAMQLKEHLKKYEPLIKRYKTTQDINKQCFINVPAMRM